LIIITGAVVWWIGFPNDDLLNGRFPQKVS
jgi:hypothetical protein